MTTEHRFTSVGVYNVVLSVTDSAGESRTAPQSVTVTDATSGTLPTASFTVSPSPTVLLG